MSMNLRHAAALALVGWYVMVPPLGKLHDPLSTWQIVKVFDSADECQSYRDKIVIFFGNKHLPMWHKTDGNGVEYFDATAAQCIASDDPRLKETK
jgi:hypothetical protein